VCFRQHAAEPSPNSSSCVYPYSILSPPLYIYASIVASLQCGLLSLLPECYAVRLDCGCCRVGDPNADGSHARVSFLSLRHIRSGAGSFPKNLRWDKPAVAAGRGLAVKDATRAVHIGVYRSMQQRIREWRGALLVYAAGHDWWRRV
jgi:hypothetical protein